MSVPFTPPPRPSVEHSFTPASSHIDGMSSSTSFAELAGLSTQSTTRGGRVAEPPLTPRMIRAQLKDLLTAKCAEVDLAGRLGSSLLAQRAALETRVREMEEEDESVSSSIAGPEIDSLTGAPVTEAARKRLEELGVEMRGWQEGNQGLLRGLGLDESFSPTLPSSPMPSSQFPSSPSFPPGSSTVNGHPVQQTPQQSSRRVRNAQHRDHDIEFATEIGQSLLVEVRRLQALLVEKDEALVKARGDTDGMAMELDGARSAAAGLNESVGESTSALTSSA